MFLGCCPQLAGRLIGCGELWEGMLLWCCSLWDLWDGTLLGCGPQCNAMMNNVTKIG